MTKKIKYTNDGNPEIKPLTITEVLELFENSFNQFAHKCEKDFKDFQDHHQDFDDFKQLAMIKATQVFDVYDIEKQTNFSTLLYTALRGEYTDLRRKYKAQKRECKNKVYLNAPIGDKGEEIGNIIKDSKSEDVFKEDSVSLEEFLIENLSEEEMLFYSIDLKKKMNKASKQQKSCLESTIDIFESIVGEVPDKKEDLAKSLGMSRPTLNKRINNTVLKVQKLSKDFILENFDEQEIKAHMQWRQV